MRKALIPAGKLTNTHGIRGQMKAEVYLDSPDYLKSFSRIVISDRDYALLSVSSSGRFAILTLEGIEDINQAMELKGKEFSIYREDALLEEGTFFLQDVVGFEVLSQSGEKVGKVVDIQENPAHPIFIVKGEEEHLIPAIAPFILSTDFDQETITVNLWEGM